MRFDGGEHVLLHGDIFGNGFDHACRSVDVGIARRHMDVAQACIGLGDSETPVSHVGSVAAANQVAGPLYAAAARRDDDGRGPQCGQQARESRADRARADNANPIRKILSPPGAAGSRTIGTSPRPRPCRHQPPA